MNRILVVSSNLNSVGYDSTTHTLEIEFNNGGIYQYYDVPQSVYDSLMSASSLGSYHANFIKNVYKYDKAG